MSKQARGGGCVSLTHRQHTHHYRPHILSPWVTLMAITPLGACHSLVIPTIIPASQSLTLSCPSGSYLPQPCAQGLLILANPAIPPSPPPQYCHWLAVPIPPVTEIVLTCPCHLRHLCCHSPILDIHSQQSLPSLSHPLQAVPPLSPPDQHHLPPPCC